MPQNLNLGPLPSGDRVLATAAWFLERLYGLQRAAGESWPLVIVVAPQPTASA